MTTPEQVEVLAAATPRPWHDHAQSDGSWWIESEDETSIGDIHRKADARLIVLAVNGLPAAEAEIERLRAALHSVYSVHGPSGLDCECEGCVWYREDRDIRLAALAPQLDLDGARLIGEAVIAGEEP